MPDEKDKDKKQKIDGNLDIFILNSTYPEAGAIFTSRPKSLDELKSECLIVLDTNALLVPYNIGKESLEQIRKTYEALIADGRLTIPGQVSREFAKNRASKLGELYQQINRKANISSFQKGKYPLLESLGEYQETLRLEVQIDELLPQYKDAIKKVLSHIRNWAWNDPVSLLYAGLFEKAVFDLQIDREKIAVELARRQTHKIPPGYKDAGKEDNGIGDLLIWLTILEIGKNHKKSVFFVSGDEKPDWWHKSEGQTLYPRYELVDEFRRHSDGQSFHIIPFSQFLEIYGASQSIVQEVRREEVKVSQELEVTRVKPVEIGEVLRFADLTLDTNTREVRRGAHRIDLTAKEFDLLELFMRHPQQVLTRETIYDRIWGYDFDGESNIIEVYVRYLRVKTEVDGSTRLLQTVRGYGYVLREE